MKLKKAYIYILGTSLITLMLTLCYYVSYKHALYGFNKNSKQSKIDNEDFLENNSISVDFTPENKIHKETSFILQTHDLGANNVTEHIIGVPLDYLGLDRERLLVKLDEYMGDMPISEYHKGLSSYEIISFSPEKVVLRKTYDISRIAYLFYVAVKDNKVVVYNNDLTSIYQYTSIDIDDLSNEDRIEVKEGIYIKTEAELYSLLESYSS